MQSYFTFNYRLPIKKFGNILNSLGMVTQERLTKTCENLYTLLQTFRFYEVSNIVIILVITLFQKFIPIN